MTSVPTHNGVKSSPVPFVMLWRGHSVAFLTRVSIPFQGVMDSKITWLVSERPETEAR